MCEYDLVYRSEFYEDRLDARHPKLIDHRAREPFPDQAGLAHVVCDIDKTYLETEFESLTRVASIAFESATDKITVTGATDVLLAVRWGAMEAPLSDDWPRPLHFVSSSPPQLRAVLEEKLADLS